MGNLSRIDFLALAFSAIAVCLVFVQCAEDRVPPIFAVHESDSLPDTGLCLAPACYPDPKPH